ncbi:MAG: hypothetical protein RL219_2249, partial [Actinomycetota bacterium]
MFRRVHRTTLDRRSAEVNVSTRGVVLAAAFMVSAGAVSVWGAAPVQGSAPRAAAVVPEPGLPVTPAVAGTPAPPSLVWREDFENNMGTTPWAVNYSTVKYTGTNSETYTGLTGWLNVAWCNGLVVAVQTTVTGGAATVGGATCIYVDQLKQLAYALGTFNGSAVVNNNHVVAAFTAGSPGAGPMVQLEQLKTLPLGLNRFVLLSLSGAAMNCGVGAPSYQFAYTKDLTTWNLVGTAINLCTSTATSTVSVPTIGTAGARADVKVGRVYSPTTFLLTGSTVAVRVGNANGGGAGNDAAFDDLTIWDATPILDKSFSPTTIAPNGVSTLTLRITNTDDLAEKKGWSFTDTFPTGLKVANPPTASTTCGTGTTVSAVAGSGVVSVTGGNLVAGAASCLVKVNVTAAAEGQYTNGAANIDPKIGMDLPLAPATLTVFAPNPKLAVTKVASPTTVTAAGQPVSYTITAKNTGNVALTNVSVSDPKVGTLSCTPTIPVATLAINASISCTGSYTATQADVDAGSIANTATATGTPPSGPAITGTGSATVTATRTPGLSVVKSVTPTMFTNPGETLNYTITATNTGNVSLTNVSVSDPKVSSLLCSPTIPVAKLAPGAQVVCSGSRVVSNADVTANIITNTATATGTPPTGSAITASGSATATGLPRNPSLAVTKTASPTAMTTVGETITYTIRATNDGDAVLTNVTVSDPMVSGLMCLPAIPVASLGLGESISCQGTYTVKQSDLDSSTPLENTATASGDSTAGSASKSAKATVTKVAAPALTVAKTVSPTSFLLPGEILNYQIRVTNTGNVTVSNVSVSDPKVSSLNCAPSLPVTSLAPGAQILCTASRTVTNSDVVAGSVVNTATASGTAPGGAPVSGSDTATSTGSPLDPKLDVTKTASPTAFSRVGETVSYTITAVNTGNVPLTNVSVSDPKAGPLSCTPALPVATLAVGASITCLGTSVVTQADVDAGSIVNTASASGTSPLGGFVGDAAALTVPGPVAAPQLSLSKSASPSTYTAAGDLLTYTIVATNTGNVTLSNVIVLDPGVASLSCSAPVPVPSLAPGERVTCTGTRAVLQVEVDSGSVANTATASGTAPGSVTVADSASTVVNGLPAAP